MFSLGLLLVTGAIRYVVQRDGICEFPMPVGTLSYLCDRTKQSTVMKKIRMCDYPSLEGTYRIPYVMSKPRNMCSSMNSNVLWGDNPFVQYSNSCVGKIVADAGTSSAGNVFFNLLDITNVWGDALHDIFFGVYRFGQPEPVWQYILDTDEHGEMSELRLDLEGLRLPVGRYFLLFYNIAPDKDYFVLLKDFAGCYRLDFHVIPNGITLPHPLLTESSIRYIQPDEAYGHERKRIARSRGPVIESNALYELSLSLDFSSCPKKRADMGMDLYELRVFDESYREVCNVHDIIWHEQDRRFLITPPHNLPFGTCHFILYHNDTALYHLWCRRDRRLGQLKVEKVEEGSFLSYLHRCDTSYYYGCLKIKKLLRSMWAGKAPVPRILCVASDETDTLGQEVAKSLFPGKVPFDIFGFKEYGWLPDELDWSRLDNESLVLWHLPDYEGGDFDAFVMKMSEWLDNHKDAHVILNGYTEKVKTLFMRSEALSKLVPVNCRWYTQEPTPYEQFMERLFHTNWEGCNREQKLRACEKEWKSMVRTRKQS